MDYRIVTKLSELFKQNQYMLKHAVINKHGQSDESHKYCYQKDKEVIKLEFTKA
jgi:hypothetical protein